MIEKRVFLSGLASAGRPCALTRGRCSKCLAGTKTCLPFLEAQESLFEGDEGKAAARVMQVAGIQNVLTKSLGTSNPHNVVKATFAALLGLKDAKQVAETRSKTVEELSGKLVKAEKTEKVEKAAGE